MPESRRVFDRRSAVFVLAIGIAASCGGGGDPVRSTLDRVARAAHSRDAHGVMNELAADFQGADGSSRADVEALLRRYFAAYEILDVELRDVQIERSDSAARARFLARLSGQPRRVGGLDALLPSSSSYRFDVRLTRQDRRWRIAWAAWNPEEGS